MADGLLVLIGALASPLTAHGDTPLRPAMIESSLSSIGSSLTEWFGTDPLWSDVYFEWADRPADRATLGVVLKTMNVLRREAELRVRGNGAYSDESVRRMLEWSAQRVDRLREHPAIARNPKSPRRPGGSGPIRAGDAAGMPRLAFVDRGTSTRWSPTVGDLDLIALMGMTLYGRLVEQHHATDLPLVARRAASMGMSVVLINVSGGPGGAGGDLLTEVQADVPARPFGARNPAPIVEEFHEPVDLPNWLANRGMIRGRVGIPFGVLWWGRNLTGPESKSPEAFRAMIWIDTVEGLGDAYLTGWRDRRDGTLSSDETLFDQPAFIEAIARSALELKDWETAWGGLRAPADLLVYVDPEVLKSVPADGWPPWTERAWSGLAGAGLRFDIRAGNLGRADGRNSYRLTATLTESGFVTPGRKEPFDVSGLCQLLTDVDRVEVKGPDGETMSGVYARLHRGGRGKSILLVVNATGQERRVQLEGIGVPREAVDLLTGNRTLLDRNPLPLKPWQVVMLGG